MCAEYGVPLDMEEIKPWLRTAELLEINPAATLPIFLGDGDQPIIGILPISIWSRISTPPASSPG